MLKRKYIIVLAVLVLGLVVSGCADNMAQDTETISEESATAPEIKDNNTSLADEALSNEMIGITDPEIRDIEEEINEIEELINETDSEKDIDVEEI